MLPVTLAEAVLGGDVEAPTPGGPVSMRVPPRADSGTELKLGGEACLPMTAWPPEIFTPN